MADDEKSPLDLATDFLVYAPVGLALAAGELLPELVDRGRAYLGGQVPMARAVGQVAVRQGQNEVSKVVDQALSQVGVALEQLLRSWASGGQRPEPPPTSPPPPPAPVATAPAPVATPPPPPPAPPAPPAPSAPPAPAPAPSAPPAPVATAPAPVATPPSAAPAPTAPPAPVPTPPAAAPPPVVESAATVGALAIADYESLSASQVLPRLAGLSADDLEAVRRYEETHRGRRTVLGRIASLQGD
jgi:outer membrane biosynthesis protein TonB